LSSCSNCCPWNKRAHSALLDTNRWSCRRRSASAPNCHSLFTPPTRTRQNCVVLSRPSFQFATVQSQIMSTITEDLKIRNWAETRQNSSKLGRRDETKLSCLVWSCVHTADTDKTRQPCLVRVGGVNKLLKIRRAALKTIFTARVAVLTRY